MVTWTDYQFKMSVIHFIPWDEKEFEKLLDYFEMIYGDENT